MSIAFSTRGLHFEIEQNDLRFRGTFSEESSYFDLYSIEFYS